MLVKEVEAVSVGVGVPPGYALEPPLRWFRLPIT